MGAPFVRMVELLYPAALSQFLVKCAELLSALLPQSTEAAATEGETSQPKTKAKKESKKEEGTSKAEAKKGKGAAKEAKTAAKVKYCMCIMVDAAMYTDDMHDSYNC